MNFAVEPRIKQVINSVNRKWPTAATAFLSNIHILYTKLTLGFFDYKMSYRGGSKSL